MLPSEPTCPSDDPFDLQRFVRAQEDTYRQALAELRRGRKATHWMWFVFPQFAGLGESATSRRFAIRSLDEARAIFGIPGDLKFRSCVTLLRLATRPESSFERVLLEFFGGDPNGETIRLAGEAMK